MQSDELIMLLKAPLGLTDDANIHPLSGGAINHTYHLSDDANDYLVKEFKGDDYLCIDRQDCFDLQLALSKKGLAPKPIYLSIDTGIYVEQWIKLKRSPTVLYFDEVHTHSLATALTDVHNSEVQANFVDLPRQWHRYLASVANPPTVLVDEVSRATEKWFENIASYPEEQVFCHNDLVWEHLCIPTKIILDWEYAGIGNRYFDLLSCAKVNAFDIRQRDLLLTAYAKQNNIPIKEVEEGCKKQAGFIELTYQLWHQALGLTPKN